MASESWWECRHESGECDDDDDPRISLSQGLFMSVDFCADSAHHAAEVGGSSYSSSEFEFLTPSLCTAAAATPHLQRSPSCSMSSADQLFCNGRILPLPLPLHQTHASHITIADHVRSERRPANEAAAANISRRLKDMLKLENPKQKKIQSTNCSRDKHLPAAARSLWFLRRCRSTNDKEDDPDCCLRSVDPWLGRSASDSRMNPFGGGGASRQASAKPQTKSFAKSDSFRSYTHFLSRNSSPRRKRSAAISSQRGSIDEVETRADLQNAMKDNRPHHASRASSKSQLSLDQGLNVPQKRTEFSRSRSQKCVEHCRSSGRQVAPVVNMQICMAQTFLTPNARLADLSFLKKHRAQKQHDVGASATGLSHEPQISSY